MSHHHRVATATAIIAILIAACGDDRPLPLDPASNVAGDRLPVQLPGEIVDGAAVAVTATVHLDERGCWFIDLDDSRRILVFPEGFTPASDDATLMVGSDGTVVTNGMLVDGLGVASPVSVLPGVPDGYWGSYLKFCEPGAVEVAVLDRLVPAFESDSLSTTEWVERLAEAEFSESWECGYQFAVSTPDQTITLIFGSAGADGAMQSPVHVGDPSIEAWVAVGKYLMASNCDDAVESWVANRTEVGRWALSSGSAVFEVPADEGCFGGEIVTAHLTGLIVDTPDGPRAIDDIEAVNTAWGCFAG